MILRKLFKPSDKVLYSVSTMIFFWVIFDSILSYIVPILISQRGFSGTSLGLIMAFSSIAGATIDFLLSRYLKNSNYLKTFLLLLLISFLFPFVLWYANHIFVYLLAMAVWGLYFDLYAFSAYDFVSRHQVLAEKRSYDFGIIELFRSLGGFIGPVLAGLLIVGNIRFFNLTFALIFLIIAAIIYVVITILSPVEHYHQHSRLLRSANFFSEFSLWKRLGTIILPVLLFMVTMNIFDAVFWTIGPLFSQVFPNFPQFSGILMALYNLPSLLTAWKVEPLTQKIGKKYTAYLSLLLAGLLLVPIGYFHSPFLVLFFIFLSSIAYSFTWPAIESAISDYVSESRQYESEIEGLIDFTNNIGYIVGPILAGVLSDHIGISHAFSTLGIIVFVIIILLFLITPKHITIKLNSHV